MKDQQDKKVTQVDMHAEYLCGKIEIVEKANLTKKIEVKKIEDQTKDQTKDQTEDQVEDQIEDQAEDQEMETASCKEKKENTVKKSWMTNYIKLIEYKKTHGNFFVPRGYQDPSLVNFVHYQRSQYSALQRNKPSYITPSHVKLLNDIGFTWSSKNVSTIKFGNQWMENYNKLKEYKKLTGNCLVPRRFEKDPSLATFVINQRRYYSSLQRDKPSPIKSIHIKLLNDIGFQWCVQRTNNSRKSNDEKQTKESLKRREEQIHDLKKTKKVRNDMHPKYPWLKKEIFENAHRAKPTDAEAKGVDDNISAEEALTRQKVLGDLCHEMLETTKPGNCWKDNFYKSKQAKYPWLTKDELYKHFEIAKKQWDADKWKKSIFEEQEKLLRQAAKRSKNVFQNKSKIRAFSNVVHVDDLPNDHWEWKDLYSRLGLPRNSSQTEIRKQYLKFARLYHPDKAKVRNAEPRFQAIKEAYELLVKDHK